RVWLSATAGTTPLDLSYLAPLLGEQTGDPVEDLAQFEDWCLRQGIGLTRGTYGKWEWARNEADLDRMKELLFDGEVPAGLRRLPQDLVGWPMLNRFLHPLALDAEGRRLYDEAWTTFRAEMDLAQRGGNPTN